MQLSGKRIVEEGIITGYDTDTAVQQQGVDLRVVKVSKVGGFGRVPKEGKTKLPSYQYIEPEYDSEGYGWNLEPGYYEITLAEGCNIPSNRAFTLVQRSSCLRNGIIIRSSQFDAGFHTDHIGTFMTVNVPVTIEYMARVCQTIVLETDEVATEDLYQGQFQGDSQRKV